MQVILILLCAGLLNVHNYVQDSDTAWVVGWFLKDLVIWLLALSLLMSATKKNAVTWCVFAVFLVYQTYTLYTDLSDTYSDETARAVLMIEGGILLFWLAKQSLQKRPKEDPFNANNYMIGLCPTNLLVSRLNMLRPLVFAQFGGRSIYANGYIYRVSKGEFVKKKIEFSKLSGYCWIDSKLPIDKKTNQYLDSYEGQEIVPILKDCSRLRLRQPLHVILIKRALRR